MGKSFQRRVAAHVFVAVSLGLGGCASVVETVGSSQDTRVLNPDTVQGERQSSWIEKATGQAPEGRLKGSPSDRSARRFRGEELDQNCDDQANRFKFFCAQRASEGTVEAPEEAKRYLAAGLTLSNELCDAWFNQLQVTQITLRQGSDMISTVGSVTAAILGFTQTPPETIGLTASVFGSAKQSVDSLAANYIVATDLTTVASAVREYRALYARDIDQAQAPWNYYTARRVIMAYDNTCSALFVRKFVNARVSGSKGDSETQPLLDAAVNAFAGEWEKYFRKQITVGELIDIYAYAILPDTPQPVRDKLAAGLRDQDLLDDEGIKFKKTGTTPVTAATLSNALFRANIDATIKARATARVDALRGQLAAEATEKAKKEKEQKEVADGAAAIAEGAKSDADSAARAATEQETKAAALRDTARKAATQLADARTEKAAAEQTVTNETAKLAAAQSAQSPGAAAELVAQAKKDEETADAAIQKAQEALKTEFNAGEMKKLEDRAETTEKEASKAEDEGRSLRANAVRLGNVAAKLESDATREDKALEAAQSEAAAANRAATGSQGQSVADLRALSTVTPLGPSGRPLDAPPTP